MKLVAYHHGSRHVSVTTILHFIAQEPANADAHKIVIQLVFDFHILQRLCRVAKSALAITQRW
jgi:hypothetical protein